MTEAASKGRGIGNERGRGRCTGRGSRHQQLLPSRSDTRYTTTHTYVHTLLSIFIGLTSVAKRCVVTGVTRSPLSSMGRKLCMPARHMNKRTCPRRTAPCLDMFLLLLLLHLEKGSGSGSGCFGFNCDWGRTCCARLPLQQ